DLPEDLPHVRHLANRVRVLHEAEDRFRHGTRRSEDRREHQWEEDAPAGRCGPADPPHDQRDEDDGEHAVDADPVRIVDRVEGLLAREEREEASRPRVRAVVRVPDARPGVIPDGELREREPEHDGVGRTDEPALEARAQATGRIREHRMRERHGDSQLCEQEAEREGGGVVAVLQLALEQAERDEGHEDPDTALRPSCPGDNAGEEERPRDDDARDRVRHRRVQVAAQQVIAVETEEDAGDGERRAEQAPPHSASPTSARIVSSDSWSFEMKPTAPLCCARRPRSAGWRLETRTICEGPPASASATSKPLMSGSATSSRTSSGSRSRTRASPEAPSPASATTS